ncbi:hypothetical protein [Streptomyces lincolnensis]|uniref:hypothetical protein n=1 Tax=Streptomyces lincolnensis TaxID=1915 RepID=UPI0008314778|nr:hypothetical protein [Streptomyces lincolnensis]QMV11292.1 hypothetical protein GJU35_40190 [Streptomyces lincolnensis]
MDVIGAVGRFPTVIFTSALVVVLGFWLLVLLGRAGVRDFDADAPALARVFKGVPVAVAASVVTVSGWLVSLSGNVVVDRVGLTGLGAALARVTLLALSALIAGAVAHGLAASATKLFRGEHRSRQRDLASGTPFDPGSRLDSAGRRARGNRLAPDNRRARG